MEEAEEQTFRELHEYSVAEGAGEKLPTTFVVSEAMYLELYQYVVNSFSGNEPYSSFQQTGAICVSTPLQYEYFRFHVE